MFYASVAHYVGFAITALADPGPRGLALGYMLSPTTWAEISKMATRLVRSRENLTRSYLPR
jgi:hypothetical protein